MSKCLFNHNLHSHPPVQLQVWTPYLCMWAMKCSRSISLSAGAWPTPNPTLNISPRTSWPLLVGSSSPMCFTERRFSGKFRHVALQMIWPRHNNSNCLHLNCWSYNVKTFGRQKRGDWFILSKFWWLSVSEHIRVSSFKQHCFFDS